MKTSHHSGLELIFTGQHLNLLRRMHRADDGSMCLIKTPAGDPAEKTALIQLEHEYKICQELHIDGILQPTVKEMVEGQPAIMFEDPGGVTLAQMLATGPVALPLFWDISIGLTDIISRLHRKGLVHKDIHAGNIIVCTDNDPVGVVLTGLGIATLMTGQNIEKTAPGKLEGTFEVMSPEQTGRMNRPVDFRTDFYSLGVVLYQMLTGILPFTGDDTLALVHAHLAVMPRAPSRIDPQIPSILSDLVLKLLAKDADDRYRSGAGIAADLKRCRDDYHSTGKISPFELARQDVSEAFHIPGKLYGRKKEIRTLQAVFDRVCGGPVELVLVTGYGGIGKTELVNQIRRSAAQKDGYFIGGKCDPLDRKVPCAPFVEAMNDAVDQILARPRERIDQVRKILTQILGDQGHVLTDVIPMLSLIIGEQPPVPELPPNQASHRFHLMMQRSFGVITLRGFPVVVFLDDLQWADFSTLKMLQTLACDTELRNLLLIGAYRDEEVDETHDLSRVLKEIKVAGGHVQTIALEPMSTEAVQALIADAMNAAPGSIDELATLCHRKTGGNPFFLKRFLLELVARKLIFFNTSRNTWQWHAEKISQADVTDNVIELMAGAIGELNENVQQALKTAACIGNRFDLDTLCVVHKQSRQTLLDNLWPAVQAGLISVLPTSGLRVAMRADGATTRPFLIANGGADTIHLSFIHDRIQEAAYSLMPKNDKMGMHLRLGRLLHDRCNQNNLDEKIFDILGQLNRALPLITEPGEIESLAELNLNAGERARCLALFESAFDYFRVGIDLMAEKGWQRHYELTKELHLKGIESAFVSGRYSELDDWFETAVHHIPSPVEAVDAYIAKIEKETTESNLLDAVDTGLSILARLGIKLPANPSEEEFRAELEKTEKLLHRFAIDDIFGLPDMVDPHHLAALRVMVTILPSAVWVKRNLHDIVTFNALRLLLRHGNCRFSALIFCTYSMSISTFLEKLKDVKHYGRLGVRFLDRYESPKSDNRARFLYYLFNSPFSEHIKKSPAPLTAVHHASMEIGQFVHAGNSLGLGEVLRFFSGEPLETVHGHMAACKKVLEKIRHKTMIMVLNVHHQMVLNLMGRSEHTRTLIGEIFDERIHLPRAQKERNQVLLLIVTLCKLILAYLFECFQDAAGLNDKIEKAIFHIPTMAPYFSNWSFYGALARLAMCETNTWQKEGSLLAKVAANQQRLQLLADAAPMNCLHMLHLVKAERARVEGRIFEAQEHFDRAIDLAEENGYLQDQALASELTAKFWMGRGKTTIAQAYMQKALDCYTRWGAAAKVKDLQEKHPEFFTEQRDRALIYPAAGDRAADLDVMSALRASRAISGEIRLDRLVEKLMNVLIENAGATCGRLLLEIDGRFYVAAEAAADRPGQITRLEKAVAVEQAEHLLPLQIIQYAQHTGKSVVIEDATAHERYGQDPYIVKNQPRSILCSPIVRKEKLIGLFYLENNLTTGAFTDERLKMLEILSAQIAVSLENAKLYESRRQAEKELKKHRDHLEELVKERTNELAAAKEQAEAANASKSDFLARMSHEIRTPLSAVTGLTNIVLKTGLTTEQRDYLDKVQIASHNLSDVINDILDFSKVEVGRLELTIAPFDLDQVMEQLADLFSDRVTQKGLKLRIEVAPRVPRRLRGDAGRLTQVLTNLIGNSIKFTDKGEIVVGVNLEDKATRDQSLASLQFSVRDTGVGIDADALPKLFDPFTQADDSLTRKHEGTGLGLAICQQLVQLMEGRIWAESTPGKGSTFSFSVMLETRMELPEDVVQRPAQEPTGVPIQHLAGKRVLVVEDSELNLLVAVALLDEIGLKIETAENGRIAVDKVTDSKPGYYDGVLMDIQMPVMNGYEATGKIREWEAASQTTDPRIPIIALTAHALKGEKEKCLAAGMDDYLAKPLDEQDLHRVLLTWIT